MESEKCRLENAEVGRQRLEARGQGKAVAVAEEEAKARDRAWMIDHR